MSFAGPPPAPTPSGGLQQQGQTLGFRPDAAPREGRSAPFAVLRSRAYSFVLDARGQPIELGSGRFAKVFLGEERWLESKTDFRRPIVIKMLQRGVNDEDHMRFQMEMELLERVQGHPNIVELFASGEGEDPNFLPPMIRDKCEAEFMILEKLDMSLEERLKGSRNRGAKEDLLACDLRERLFRVLDYMIPVASAVEYAHLVRNICHRDIKPANVLIGLPDPNLRGSTLGVRLADFNVAKLSDEEVQFGMTQMKAAVPGTLFFQSPEQETNILELLVNVQQGVPEVEYFEDFYIQIAKNDSFSLFNRNEQYPILYADRARKRLVLARPYRELSETNVRARIQKSVGRDQRRLREPEDALRRVPQVHRVRTRRREQHDRGLPPARVQRHQLAARAEDPGRTTGGRSSRPVLLLQALPRRQRRAHRSERDADHRQVHDPQQAG
ncbi:MAG: serine/threonine protein kinase [Labilithrix sp.]|nr:serine/threonine protein kinase [Labilithrix sp.]